MTKIETYEVIKGYVANNEELVNFCNRQIELLSKKSNSVNSKRKAITAERAERVYNALAEMDKPVTITELKTLTSDAEVANWSPQRISALMRTLGEKRVLKTYEKKNALFSVA